MKMLEKIKFWWSPDDYYYPQKSKEREHSYHEAGHIIADIVYGHKFQYATTKGVYGFVIGDSLKLAVGFYSGPLSQQKFKGYSILFCCGGSDVYNAVGCIIDAVESSPELLPYHMCSDYLKIKCYEKAEWIVNNNWVVISSIAEELNNKHKMTYEEVINFLNKNNMYELLKFPIDIELEPKPLKYKNQSFL